MVRFVKLCVFVDLTCSWPSRRKNLFSRGLATIRAISSGEAPSKNTEILTKGN